MPITIRILTYLIVFLFPVLTNLVEHAGSATVSALVVFGIFAWVNRKTKPLFDPFEKSVLWSFAAYFIVTLVFYFGHGFLTEKLSVVSALMQWRPGHELRMLGFIPIYYLFYRTGLKRWVWWHGAAMGAILCGIYGVVYIYVWSAGDRATNAYEPIEFGTISLVLGFISLSGIRYFYEKHKILIIIPLLAVFSGIFASVLSGTRIAFVAIPFLTLVFFLQLGAFRRPWIYRSILIFSMIAISVICYHLPKTPLKHRLQAGITDVKSFFENGETGPYAVHLGLWREGWKLFMNHPWLGNGRSGYKAMIMNKSAANQIPAEIAKYGSPHNMYLLNMTAYGVSGLLILLAIFISPLLFFIRSIKANREAQDLAYSGILLIVGFMLFGITEHIFMRNINVCFYTIMLAAILALTQQFRVETQ